MLFLAISFFLVLLNLCLPLVFIAQDKLKELTGPGKWEQWTHWKSKTQDHRNRGATKGELEKILSAEKVRKKYHTINQLLKKLFCENQEKSGKTFLATN